MNMATIIALLVVCVIVGAALIHIHKAKKSGARCIGCPSANSGSCPHCNGNKK